MAHTQNSCASMIMGHDNDPYEIVKEILAELVDKVAATMVEQTEINDTINTIKPIGKKRKREAINNQEDKKRLTVESNISILNSRLGGSWSLLKEENGEFFFQTTEGGAEAKLLKDGSLWQYSSNSELDRYHKELFLHHWKLEKEENIIANKVVDIKIYPKEVQKPQVLQATTLENNTTAQVVSIAWGGGKTELAIQLIKDMFCGCLLESARNENVKNKYQTPFTRQFNWAAIEYPSVLIVDPREILSASLMAMGNLSIDSAFQDEKVMEAYKNWELIFKIVNNNHTFDRIVNKVKKN